MSAGRFRMSCRYCGSTAVHWYVDQRGAGYQGHKWTMMNSDGSPHDCPEKRADARLRADIRAGKTRVDR